jgi:hypothetical protein
VTLFTTNQGFIPVEEWERLKAKPGPSLAAILGSDELVVEEYDTETGQWTSRMPPRR